MAMSMIRALRTAGDAYPYAGGNLSSLLLRIFSNPGPLLSPPAVPARDKFRFFSSEIDSLPESDPSRTSRRDSLIDEDYVSDEELKRRIEKFYAGDLESIPSIFEAILKRKLGGKSEEADEEIMKEIRSRMPEPVDDIDDEQFDSELDELCKTDEETEDLSDTTDSDEDDTKRVEHRKKY